ncbi:EAL domain-containing protein [Peribacillus saganii]|uniref:EAL domain-containing protein n=1 Tax=Peribacillus saganii TaxID=2303992 RepID=A0A372LF12_9BACI|nr:EAL domain-containing protein [Peribacillus saganii]RFU64491.1 EAL domain-containing protein [Peribacillus saganii]
MDQVKIEEHTQQMIALIRELPDFICFKDGEGRWLLTNPFSLRLFQLENVPYKGKTDSELAVYSPFFRDALIYCEERDKEVWESGKVTREEEIIPQLDNTEKIFDVIKVPLFHTNGQRNGLIVIGRDVTERKMAEKNIKHLAYHDELTGLPNRRHLYESLNEEFLERNHFALLFIDLDRFKVINDSLGHLMGDELLQKVSQRLVQNMVKGKLYRHSGDEFILLVPNAGREDAEFVARELLRHLDTPFELNSHEIYISASIGICLSNDVGRSYSAEEIIKLADLAMYQAKQEGKHTYRFYSESIESTGYTLIEMETKLHKALERNEFILHYQPQVNLETGEVCGIEALIRWNHPQMGFVSPADFIPLAEETGLIIPIGKWVLSTACRQNKELQDKGLPPIVVSVNLSAIQFYQHDLVEVVDGVLKESGLDPRYLELEITESMTMDVSRTIKILNGLKKLGVKISIDDFGTGYSSLAYLKKFPIDKLKIDQSFVAELLKDSNDATIVQTIIAMAKNMGLRVNAEGVETKEQFLLLQQHFCNEVQGYLLCKPLPLDSLLEKLPEVRLTLEKLGVLQSLNERLWVEESLRVARQNLQATIKLQQGMTFKYKQQDDKFIHTLGDGELLYRMGLSPELLIGKTVHDFLPDTAAERKIDVYQKAWNGEKVTYEGEKNGIHYLAALNPITSGGRVVEVVASCVDITERKQVEKKLKESEERLRQLIEIAPDAILVHQSGKIEYINEAGVKLFGATTKDLIIGKSFLDFIHPQQHEVIMERINHVYQDKKTLKPFNMKIIRSNNQTINVESTAALISFNSAPAIQNIFRIMIPTKTYKTMIPSLTTM